MTVEWKKLVLATLEANEKAGRKPANLAQLAKMIPADKRGTYVTFDLELDPPKISSVDVDRICEILKIAPPMVASSVDDPDLERDLDVVRAMNPETRRALIVLLQQAQKP